MKNLRWFVPACLVSSVLALAFCPLSAGTGDDEREGGRSAAEKEVALQDVPAEVQTIIREQSGGAEISEIEEMTRGDLKIYEAEWLMGGKEVEVQVMFVCRLVGKSIEPAEEDDAAEGEDEGGEEEDYEEIGEREVSFNQIPAAVREALAKEAGKNRIVEIEEIISSKGKLYEAEWLDGKWVVEILLGADGAMLCKESALRHGLCICHGDDDDDDDEEDDD